ncbi:hypothetical protein C5167_041877 [Papaver somniferum]|nr:hypothetical protein C5167_041877 [Papaver somniferum]
MVSSSFKGVIIGAAGSTVYFNLYIRISTTGGFVVQDLGSSYMSRDMIYDVDFGSAIRYGEKFMLHNFKGILHLEVKDMDLGKVGVFKSTCFYEQGKD